MIANRYVRVVPLSSSERTVLVLSVHGMRALADALEATDPDLATRLREEADIRQRAAEDRIAKRQEQSNR